MRIPVTGGAGSPVDSSPAAAGEFRRTIAWYRENPGWWAASASRAAVV
jgi:hypothetical protein